MNEQVFFKLSYGLYVITALDGENQRYTGCIVNSLVQATAVPITIVVSVHHDNHTNKCIKQSGVFGISILSEECDPSIIGRFGFQSGKEKNKFDGLDYEVKAGAAVLKDSCGYFVCKVIDSMEAPTHTIFLANILEAEEINTLPPMTYAYYRQVIRGTSPKNAPTYRPKEDEKQKAVKRYKCSVCGYVYEGDTPFEDLPDTYRCPICGALKDKFVPVMD